MKNISFFYTYQQMLDRIKSVTRRFAWWKLAEIDLTKEIILLMAVEKCQGIKKGELNRLYPIRILSARIEPLNRMTTDLAYGYDEVIKEGFPNWTPFQFVEFICDEQKVLADALVNRIEFVEWSVA